MIFRLAQHFRNRVLLDNRGFLDSLFTSEKKSESESTSKRKNYPEADQARELWAEKLFEWGGAPDYGAMAPDWADIWSLAQQRIQDTYRGTPTSQGVYDRVKASAARRGVSESPAMENTLARAGAEEGQDIADLAKNQAIAEAEFSERGRQNWLNSIMGLAQIAPESTMQKGSTTQTSTPSKWDQLTEIAAAVTGGLDGLQDTSSKSQSPTQGSSWNQEWLNMYFAGI